jgi:hypothetical protein
MVSLAVVNTVVCPTIRTDTALLGEVLQHVVE